MAASATGAPAGSRRFWITVLCFALANAGIWVAWDQFRANRKRYLLRVESFLPGNNAQVSARQSLQWRFNLDVAADRTQPPGTLSPAVAGQWKWEDARTLLFIPEQDLPRATRIVAKLNPQRLRTADGFFIKDVAEAVVHTTPLRVLDVFQFAFEDDGRFVIAIRFNDRVLPGDVLNKLTVRGPAGVAVGFKLHGQANGAVVRIITDPIPAPSNRHEDHQISVRIAEGLAGVSGPLGLEQAHQTVIALDDHLIAKGLVAAYPANERPALHMQFNGDVDHDVLKQVLSVEPAIPFTIKKHYWKGWALYGDFQPSTRYSVKIGPPPAGANRRKYPRPDVLSAMMPDRQPGVWFEHTEGYLGSQGNRTLLAHAVNLTELQVSIFRVYDNNIVAWRNAGRRYDWADTTRFSQPIATATIPIAFEKNKLQDIPLCLADLLPSTAPRDGVYRVRLVATQSPAIKYPSSYRDRIGEDDEGQYQSYGDMEVSALATLSDIGVTAKQTRSGLTAFAVSLSTAKPLANVRIRVYSNKNQLLAESLTRGDGIANIANISPNEGEKVQVILADQMPAPSSRPLPPLRRLGLLQLWMMRMSSRISGPCQTGTRIGLRLPGTSLPPFFPMPLVHQLEAAAATQPIAAVLPATQPAATVSRKPASEGTGGTATGLTWLDMRNSAWDRSDSDTAGRSYLRNGYEAFVYSERGIYRPGETVHLRAIVRGADLTTPSPFPVRWQIRRPDQHDYRADGKP